MGQEHYPGSQDQQDTSYEDQAAPTEVNETTSEVVSDVDALLDEIDDVLEINAEEFVRSYVQKGGQ